MAEKKNEVAEKPVEETKPVVKNNKVTDYSLGLFGTSDNFIMACQMAKALASSTLVPREYQGNESNCIIAIDMSQRLGASPFSVMQNLDIIQGRPSWSAKALIGMINSSHMYDFELQFDEKQKNGKPFSCMCWTEKKGRKVVGPVIDMQMADDEGWTKKNGSKWKTMPQVMLRYRAASFFSRMNCPEVSMGLYTSDEVIDGDFKEYRATTPESIQTEVKENQCTENFDEPIVDEQKGEVVADSNYVESNSDMPTPPFA